MAYAACPNCRSAEDNATIYRCDDCHLLFCSECRISKLFGYGCPRCDKKSHTSVGSIELPDEDDDDDNSEEPAFSELHKEAIERFLHKPTASQNNETIQMLGSSWRTRIGPAAVALADIYDADPAIFERMFRAAYARGLLEGFDQGRDTPRKP